MRSNVPLKNISMTLRFHMGREDVLEFSRQYHLASPTYQRTRMRVRWMLPTIMIGLWVLTTARSGFEWTSAVIFLAIGLLWFIFYPARYDRNVQKYCEKTVDEGSYHKNFGECELTLSDLGLHSVAPSGESKFHWASVDRILLTESYLFIFLNGPIGYPIPISEIGREPAFAAYEYATQHIKTNGEQGVAPTS
jgi:hypothetical protein